MRLLIILILVPILGMAQTHKSIDIRDILEEWVMSEDSFLTYSDIEVNISSLKSGFRELSFGGSNNLVDTYIRDNFGDNIKTENGRIKIDKVIILEDVIWTNMELWNLQFRGLIIDGVISESSSLFNCKIENQLTIMGGGNEDFPISSCSINTFFISNLNSIRIVNSLLGTGELREIANINVIGSSTEEYSSIRKDPLYLRNSLPGGIKLPVYHPLLRDTSFFNNYFKIIDGYPIDLNSDDAELFFGGYEEKLISISGESLETVEIRNSDFPYRAVEIEGRNLQSLRLIANNFNYLEIWYAAKELVMGSNHYRYGLSLRARLKEIYFNIPWSEIKGNLVIKKNNIIHTFTDPGIVANKDEYYRYSSILRPLIVDYKEQGMLEEANEAVIELKNVEAIRQSEIFREKPSFGNFFRVVLNKILFTFVRYGTDPSQAMVISFYIIIIFAVFYVFFPSDWDMNSKGKLISDFKVLVNKNERGYFKPFIQLLGGLFLSFLNAITLSINAFVTLGFGSIPTRGAARYVCIIQGFIGWFLLSVFTVALFNQVII